MAILFSGAEPFVQFLCRVSRGTILWNYCKFEPVFQEMSFKVFSYLELWQPSCSVDQNHLCNFERGHHEKDSCEVI